MNNLKKLLKKLEFQEKFWVIMVSRFKFFFKKLKPRKDLKVGIETFCNEHPETDYVYDIKDFTAILLKR